MLTALKVPLKLSTKDSARTLKLRLFSLSKIYGKNRRKNRVEIFSGGENPVLSFLFICYYSSTALYKLADILRFPISFFGERYQFLVIWIWMNISGIDNAPVIF